MCRMFRCRGPSRCPDGKHASFASKTENGREFPVDTTDRNTATGGPHNTKAQDNANGVLSGPTMSLRLDIEDHM